MKIQEIRKIAKGMGLKVDAGISKQDLIREIQIAEGNSPCFKDIPECGITICLWREDCLAKSK
jgi:hypothetical protein